MVFHWWRTATDRSKTVLGLSVGVVIAGLGQVVGLPMFIASLGSGGTPYFVLFCCSVFFNLLFWPLAWLEHRSRPIDEPTKRFIWTWKGHFLLAFIGASDAFNGILTVYASNPERVPAALQPILVQFILPATLIVSKVWLKKQYTPMQLLGAVLVFASAFIYLTPTLHQLAQGEATTHFQQGWWWVLVFIGATIPGATMNVAEEVCFEHVPSFPINLLLAIESWYQLVVVGIMWWTDLKDVIPIGTSENMDDFKTNFGNGWKCLVDDLPHSPRCNRSVILALIFAFSYSATYIFGSRLMKMASANYTGLLSSLTNPLAVVFWLVFSGLNRWAGGKPMGRADVLWACLAIPVMLLGALLFRLHEDDTATKRGQSRAVSGRVGFAHVPPHILDDDELQMGNKTEALLAADDVAINGTKSSSSKPLLV